MTDIYDVLTVLERLEKKVDSLEANIKVVNAYIDTQLHNKYYSSDQSLTRIITNGDLSKFTSGSISSVQDKEEK